ncbi:MAG: DUF4058 family protein [Chloroflexi bacterium]|nr:DUF4058 family protein [Chloroflexota bacterium]
MPTPFPGMDPYLEQPWLWPDVHTALIVAVRDYLAPQLRPRYRVAVDLRVYAEPEPYARPGGDLLGRPDLWIAERPPESALLAPVAAAPIPLPQVVELPMPDRITERFLEVRQVETNEVITVIELLSPANKRSWR